MIEAHREYEKLIGIWYIYIYIISFAAWNNFFKLLVRPIRLSYKTTQTGTKTDCFHRLLREWTQRTSRRSFGSSTALVAALNRCEWIYYVLHIFWIFWDRKVINARLGQTDVFWVAMDLYSNIVATYIFYIVLSKITKSYHCRVFHIINVQL